MEPSAPPITPRETVEGESGGITMVSTQWYSNGTRPEHGTLARCNYGLLAPEEPAGNPAATGPQGNGDEPKDTTVTGGTDGRETRTGQ